MTVLLGWIGTCTVLGAPLALRAVPPRGSNSRLGRPGGASTTPTPPEGAQLAPWDGPAVLMRPVSPLLVLRCLRDEHRQVGTDAARRAPTTATSCRRARVRRCRERELRASRRRGDR